MERLTHTSPLGERVSYGACANVDCLANCDGCGIDKIISRLWEYEETGLTPEEIKAITSTTVLRINRELTDTEVDELLKMLKQQPATLTVCGADEADVCVCCGEIVPEGRQVCPTCEKEAGL